MALSRQHELHQRRFSRNLGLGLVLLAFVGLMFGLTMVKVSNDEFSMTLEDRFDPQEAQ